MKILVTGCKGQLGNEMQLLEEKNPQHLYFNTDVEDLDITDEVAIERYVDEHEIDGIVNCAAYTAVDKAEENPSICRMLNATAPGFLAAAVERRGGWMIQISTDYVFDGTGHQPYVETDPTCPDSIYGTTKLEGEQTVMATCHRTMIIRTAWLYSAFGNNFVKTMIRLGKERQELGVIFDQVGTPTYARDLAVAIFAVINQGVVPGIYHFSNEGVISWYDFAKAIHRIAGITDCEVRPLHTVDYPTPARRPHYSVLDKTKIKETYGISIPYWEESLADCMKDITREL
ncbi:dTDP-4-dehydrorhamnose reductase [Prevotella aff. ruminicola Tc2-24]|uniref:dTDP-4-dehydrorhamnose reductase n=1 Tax=Prevotella aff. ruminicola Tc2-24 TaxID=81582 RepID=A0A1I0MGL7_9BACT|nr:dTDP-4-dehydrorhamnose reductase [Prevotella aff. ruminicola Tc2-24]SEV87505.1 dTDP-4-dehydrorhamnose reductase [Prevotella aff. ruminicola Tc2-24]